MNSAPAPAGKGEPGTEKRAPLVSIAKAETFPASELAMNAKLAVGPACMGVKAIPPPHPFVSNIASISRPKAALFEAGSMTFSSHSVSRGMPERSQLLLVFN